MLPYFVVLVSVALKTFWFLSLAFLDGGSGRFPLHYPMAPLSPTKWCHPPTTHSPKEKMIPHSEGSSLTKIK